MKKFFVVVLSMIAVCVCAVALTACGEKKHTHSYSDKIISPTCTEQGYTLHSCVCGDSFKDIFEDALGHDEVSHNGQSATCSQKGWQDYITCSRCDYTTYQEIDYIPHNIVIDDAVPASCTQTGLTEGSHCSECGKTIDKQSIIDKSPHKESDWIIDENATCSKEGIKHTVCLVCEETLQTQSIKKTNHSFTNYISNSDWTCTLDGTKTAKCDYCTVTNTTVDIGSAKHTPKLEEKENDVPPTYETEGYYDLVIRCATCNSVLSTEHITVNKLTPSGTDIYSKTLTVSGDTIRGTFANGTKFFRFSSDILVADNATYSLCADILGTQVIPTKIAPLETGDNIFYLLVENDVNESMTYIVILRVRPMYIVSFDTDGGTIIDNLLIEEGSEVTQNIIPQKKGYSFNEWSIDDTMIEFPYIVTQNLIIKANYNANEYEVSLNANGGTLLDNDTQKILFGEKLNFLSPTKINYVFVGWSYNNNILTSDYQWDITENCELIAVWEYFIELELKADNTYKVIGINDKSLQIIEIPSNYQGILITEIASRAICDNELLHTVIISSSITVLNEQIIKDCKKIHTLFLPFIEKNIGSYFEFSTLDEIDSTINIPISLTTISIASGVVQGLSNCDNLETIIVGENVTSILSCSNCKKLKNVIWEGVSTATSISNNAFRNCVSLTDIIIPHSVTLLGMDVFVGCTNLESVTFEDCPSNCTNRCKTKWNKSYWNGNTPSSSRIDVTDPKANADFLKVESWQHWQLGKSKY